MFYDRFLNEFYNKIQQIAGEKRPSSSITRRENNELYKKNTSTMKCSFFFFEICSWKTLDIICSPDN